MALNFLNLNDDKADDIVIGNRYLLLKSKHRDLIVDDDRVSASSFVKNIGASLESSLLIETEIKAKCKSAWWQLYQISKIQTFLTTEQLKTVTLSLVLTKLDQKISLLYNLPDYLLLKLQRVQNSMACLVLLGVFGDVLVTLVTLKTY